MFFSLIFQHIFRPESIREIGFSAIDLVELNYDITFVCYASNATMNCESFKKIKLIKFSKEPYLVTSFVFV